MSSRKASARDQDIWTDRKRMTSMCRARPIVIKCIVSIAYGSSLMTLAHRVGPVLGPIAPPGSARRRVLRFGYRVLRSLPRLQERQFVATKLATLGDRVSLRLA